MRFVAFGALVAALVLGAFPARAAAPPSAPLAPVLAFVRDLNAADKSAAMSHFTADAAVVDEIAPYRFGAPGGPGRWYDALAAYLHDAGSAWGKLVPDVPKFVAVSGVHAWATVPMTYRYDVKGTPETETGIFVFTLLKTNGAWKITTASWATLSDTGRS